MKKKRVIEFECEHCWIGIGIKHFKFQTNDWITTEERDWTDGRFVITVQTVCPKCERYCCKRYSMSELLEMIFELQEKIK